MFFSRKPKKIPIIKELLFANYHYQFRHFKKWEDLQRLSYEDLEGKVRAELFGLTTIEQYKDFDDGYVFFRPNYKPEFRQMASYDSIFNDRYEIVSNLYDEQFMSFYEIYKKSIKKKDPTFYKKLRKAEKESTKQLTIYSGELDVYTYEKEYKSKKDSIIMEAIIKTDPFIEEMNRKREEEERLLEEELERQELEWLLASIPQDPSVKVQEQLAPYIEKGYKLAIDTNLVIDYPTILKLYPNDILFSKKVFDELDGLKSDQGQRGKLARNFFRYYEQLQSEGVIIPFLPVDIHYCPKNHLDMKKPDEVILSTYLKYKEKEQVNVLFLSKDRGARILAKNFGLETLDGDNMDYFRED